MSARSTEGITDSAGPPQSVNTSRLRPGGGSSNKLSFLKRPENRKGKRVLSLGVTGLSGLSLRTEFMAPENSVDPELPDAERVNRTVDLSEV